MEYNYKSEFVKRTMECSDMGAEAPKKLSEQDPSNGSAVLPFILGGYYDSLRDGAEQVGKTVSLDYDFVQDLSISLISLANLQREGNYTLDDNAKVTMKTLAAYLTLLAVEEHDLSVKVEKGIGTNYAYKTAMWADLFYLVLGGKRNSDLLPAAVSGSRQSSLAVDNGFVLNVDPLVKAYKKLTGVDLAEKGLANMIVTLSD